MQLLRLHWGEFLVEPGGCAVLQGFQQQTAKWPVQPVEVAARYLLGQGKGLTVADFGCGDAQLAALARQKVHSLDLVSSAPGVIACNMAHTPLGEAPHVPACARMCLRFLCLTFIQCNYMMVA